MSIWNKKQIKIEIKAIAETARAHKFSIVSNEYLEDLERRVKHLIREDIKRLPSKGKTIFPVIR